MNVQGKPAAFITAILLAVLSLTFLQARDSEPEKKSDDTPTSRMWREFEHDLPLTHHNLYNGRTLLKHRDKINLTPDQVTRIENLTMEFEAFYIGKSGEIKSKELRFAFYLRSGKKEPDRKEMANYIREISSIKTDVIVKHVHYLLDLKKILTDRQLELLEKLEEKNIKPENKNSVSRK